ncbi:membrane protein [Roseovarius sp. 22II1-1F6A]|nr:metal ABC transporter permease [Actibacterium sp.]OWU70690.1 membrane protein [Roseovarius sp. 22II1-1F6A]|tara:strand:+ start:1009 stop:1851 length:843 start_codon:yes stop_codon:yes gene_type:complete
MIETLILPFQLPFMQQAFAIAGIVAVPCALLSCFLVLKGWSLMGDAVSHAVLPGIVLAYLLGLPLAIGAFAAGIGCSLAVGYLDRNSRIKQDTVMGIVFSGMFALGLVMYVAIPTEMHLDHVLFGDMLGTSAADLIEVGAIALVITVLIAVFWRDLVLHAFDPAQARASGLRTGWLHYGLLGGLSLTIVAALTAVGIILSVALLIAPGATAFLLVRRIGTMLLTAVAISVGASLTGVYASFYLDSAPAPTVVLTMTLLFVLAFIRAARRRSSAERQLREA